jgi:ABC-type Zn2+ transport system substrate-binding protein/surface adhesin
MIHGTPPLVYFVIYAMVMPLCDIVKFVFYDCFEYFKKRNGLAQLGRIYG